MRLLASKEDSAPIQIDPDTLDTVGEFSWDGDLSSQTATAHPKIDPRDGSLVFFGYMARGETTPDIAYYEADAPTRRRTRARTDHGTRRSPVTSASRPAGPRRAERGWG
jgi:carotenoid cleavage dioxygenase-like enzyme